MSGGIPHLVVLAPDSDRGRRIPLDKDYLLVGREPTSDVRFDDPHVSRTHAALQRHGNGVYVEDLGSSGGTFVNGAAATAPRELRDGDVLTFASVTARLESSGAVTDETRTLTALPARPQRCVRSMSSARASSTTSIATSTSPTSSTSTSSARTSSVRSPRPKRRHDGSPGPGFLMFVVGFGIFAAADLSFIKGISDSIQNGGEPRRRPVPSGGKSAAFRSGWSAGRWQRWA